MSKPILFQNIRIELNLQDLEKKLRIEERPNLIKKLSEMVLQLEKIAKPTAIVLPVFPRFIGNQTVLIEGLEFQSIILKKNLEQASSSFAVVVTSGWEVEIWTRAFDDILFQYWADFLAEEVLQQTVNYTNSAIKSQKNIKTVSWMTPGSLDDWPIDEQEKLFGLFAGKNIEMDVRLTENNIMQPQKSLSGLVFSSDEPFFSCQLCDKEKCNKRRAKYNVDLYSQKYGLKQ